MREIKFRAWDKNQVFDRLSVGKMELFDDMLGFRFQHFDADPEDIVFDQFTGLVDKHGKEIYEGDIIRRKYQSQPLVVVFLGGAFLLAIEINGSWEYIDDILEADEVIGNIHENPELLNA